MKTTTELLFHQWRGGRLRVAAARALETLTANSPAEALACVDEIERSLRRTREADAPWRNGWVCVLSYDFGTDSIAARVSAKPRLLPFARFHRIRAGRAVRAAEIAGRRAPTCQLVSRTDTRSSYVRKVSAALGELRSGNAFEVNLSQRWTWRFRQSPDARALFSKLSAALRPRFGFFERAGPDAILGFSPELFFEQNGRRIVADPIKGTAVPGAPLLTSEKDRAELLMITDLFRNDLGKICDSGTVRATGPHQMALPYARHLYARITGTLRRDATLGDILTALFPSGSVTGAPKIAACEIIDRLEPFAREEAFGAVGWVGRRRSIFSVSIRTALLHGRDLRYTAGGGITVYSDPVKEYEETLLKARRFMKCLPVRNR